jgi:hypothetical protein
MIWIDLDETLVSTSEFPSEEVARVLLKFKGGSLWSSPRPGAVELLGALRALGEVRMLTTAVRVYAHAASVKFGFGFAPEEIVAREQWLKDFAVRAAGVDPRGILIDNESAVEWHFFKRSYLGIGRDRLLLLPDYMGMLPDTLQESWPKLVERAREIMSR